MIDDAQGASRWYAHENVAGDGANGVDSCVALTGRVSNDWDCDDGDPSEPVYADASAPSGGTGSFDAPFSSLQDAIDVSSSCVAAMPGSYSSIEITSSIEVLGVGGPVETTIDAGGQSCIIRPINNGTCEMDGVTVTIASHSNARVQRRRGSLQRRAGASVDVAMRRCRGPVGDPG
ncbi:MAG: hypothetical protein GY913_33765 [Proteobacteria bacterium]|nr:hypothetical protein [Pseudomonadota bacterium]